MTTEPTLKSSPSSTNIYSRFELCRPERTDTIDALAQFASSDITGLELTPSAAIRDRYYQSTRNLHHDNGKEEEEEEEEEGEGDEKVEVEEEISGDILDYRPGEGEVCAKPESIYSMTDSVISLRTEYDARSIHSVRTVDDRLQGRSATMGNLNSFVKTARKVSRSGTLFRSEKKLQPFVPLRDQFDKTENSSVKTTGGMSLLSKLSKSTAPVRAKLSALSAFTHKNSRVDIGPKRAAASVYNMPVSVPSKISLNRPLYTSRTNSDRSIPQVEELPFVYPALLSKVAQALKETIILTSKTQHSIKYKDVFDGKEAVDKLSGLIKSSDRNLALLLGRALDAQKFFRDVNYEHRLRDDSQELYRFNETLRPVSKLYTESLYDLKSDSMSELNVEKEDLDDLPTGVFTLLTDCYSPTCTRDRLCYSASCPRRQEQEKNFTRGHSREASQSYMIAQQQEDRLWINTVPKSLLDTLSKEEKKRQENIFELIYTEKDFVDDLEYMKENWINPLLDPDTTVTGNTEELVKEIFWNIEAVHSVNEQLSKDLLERQSSNQVVDKIGDILLSHVAKFDPFVEYGAHQIIGKYAFETEKTTNPSFAEFVNMTERLPQSRKLELNGYLTKPTTRLGRYNLLLREILKNTPKGHSDLEEIPKAMLLITKFLTDVNTETGKEENRFNLRLLDERLVNKNISNLDLDLLANNRQIVMKGTWKKGSGAESSDVLVYLLDHCLLIIKPKQNEEKYKLYRKPIPLALLSLSFPDHTKRASTIIPLGRPSNVSSNASSDTNQSSNVSNTTSAAALQDKSGHPIAFVHLGKQSSGPMTLYAPTIAFRKQWADRIEGQRKTLVEKHNVFHVHATSERFFSSFDNKVNCIAVFDKGRSFVLGGDKGVYFKSEMNGNEPVRVLTMDKVSQIDVIQASNLILVLADKILYAYSLDTLRSNESGIKRGRKISSHVSFFKVGKICGSDGVEKTLVCFVRNNAMTSTIRALEPSETTEAKKKHKHFGHFIRSKNEALKVYKDLYIPGEASSIQFFKNIICVGSPRGFQMVNLSSAEVQSVLDPNDQDNNSLLAEHEYMKPISMFRHKNGNILLCYNELAFYIDKKGKRAHKDWCISWEGSPTAFSFRFPYVVAFNSNFIEVRHIDTGDLLQVIPGNNIRCLYPDSTDRIYGVMDDRLTGFEIIFELNLVDPHRRSPSMIKNKNKVPIAL